MLQSQNVEENLFFIKIFLLFLGGNKQRFGENLMLFML